MMKKRIISFVLCVVMVLSLFPYVFSSVNAYTEGYDGMGPVKLSGGQRDMKWPVPGYYNIQSCFYDHRDHYAIDISANKGTTVVATYAGTVVATYTKCTHNYGKESRCCNDGYGNYVVLKHTYTKLDGSSVELYSRYSHLTDVNVSVGQSVSMGTTIGTVGSTGYSGGFHLDFQTLYGGWAPRQDYSIDPYSNQLLELPSNLTVYDAWACGKDYYELIKALYATPLEHECNKGTYKWYWDSHPHYKEYECSRCGKVNPFYDETVDLNTCESCRPGKPVLTVDVNDDHVATFTWEETTKTTHYNLWLEKKGDDGNWNSVKQFYEAESGLVYTLEAGEYRAQLLSYNSQMWEPDNSDWVHTWADDVYFSVEDVCRHNYTTTHVDATCVDYGYTTYTCTICGDTYTVYDGDYTEWSTTKPSGVDESLIETKTQYRYADKETTTSYEPSLSGWTQAGSQWEQSGSGSIEYVKSWPSGFLTSHSLYSTYNKTPKSASETSTDKTAINSDNVTGYLYYHWCRGTYDNGPINRGSRSTKQGEFTAFHAFYSTTNPSTLTSDSDGSVIYSNGDCCKDTYWYFYTPVNTQTYTTYRKLFTYERLGSWSDWSDTVYTASDSRSVETRTMYRAVSVALGDHDYQNGYCTVCGAEDPYYNFEPVVLTVANVSAEPGSTVTIPVTISDNTGFAGFTLCIDYNESVMTLTNISKGDLLNTSESGSFTKNVSGKTINWVDSTNITGDGELMKLTFTVDEDAAPGNYDVSLNLKNDHSTNFVDENSRAIHVEFVCGIVSVQKSAPVITLEKIEVAALPTKTVYQIGEALETAGLTLKATYSDGSTKSITSGFTVSGFDSATAGTKTVTVRYEGKTTTFTVTVKQTEVDPNAPQIIVASKTVSHGGTITLDVDIANNPGFSALNVAFLYNEEYLTLTKIENLLTSMIMTQESTVVWDATADHTGDGTICRLTFEVSEDTPEGDYEIRVLFLSASNSDFEEVIMTGVSGTLKVSAVIYGDVNGDGKIASVDLAMLRKYIASADPITGESSVAIGPGADCNGDGKVNSIDLAMLRKYLACLDPITGESTVKMGPQ